MNWLHVDAWKSTTAPLTSGTAHERTPQLLNRIIDQFGIETSHRYKETNGATKCNIFVWDVTRALGCEIPQREIVSGRGLVEQNANMMIEWLRTTGQTHGWSRSDAKLAQYLANEGRPVVVGWLNPKGIGHIAMVVPGTANGVSIAQAGATCFRLGNIERGFGTRTVEFFTHA